MREIRLFDRCIERGVDRYKTCILIESICLEFKDESVNNLMKYSTYLPVAFVLNCRRLIRDLPF